MYINREISWLEFNQRVLDQALRPELPLLERVRLLSISASNLDEFFQVRVGGLMLLRQTGKFKPDLTGLSPSEQLERIRERAGAMVDTQYHLLQEVLMPLMVEAGLSPQKLDDLTEAQHAALEEYFINNISPILTPLAMEVEQPPMLPNLSLILGVELQPAGGG
jgi:polyphosphate kinase